MHHHCGHAHHSHSHNDSRPHFGKSFLIGAVINIAFIAVEVFYGLVSNSLALLADAGHNAGDVLSLFIAWGAYSITMKSKPTARFTYGLGGTSILAALINASLIMVAIGAIGWEAISRFKSPHLPGGVMMMVVAGVGVFVNGITAWLFSRGASHDLNMRGVFQHMFADAIISFAVLVSGVLIQLTAWTWVDPVITLVILAVIIAGTWQLLKDSLSLALQAVPTNIDPQSVREFLGTAPGVKEVHDLHIWATSTSDAALSAHLLMPSGHPGDAFITELSNTLQAKFGISHATIQIELGDTGVTCKLAPDHVI